MKATFALLAIAAAFTVVAAPALARTDPTGTTFITDTLGGNGSALTAVAPQGYRFITDTLAPGGGTPLTVASSVSFSWSDAGVGAATAAGIILALIGGVLLVTRRRGSLAI